MTTAKIETPKVYGALASILNQLSVGKNGTLPSNMGGKPYITAVDVAAEVKRQFVAHNLILLPSETIIKHETVIHKERLSIAIAVTGEYTIISTEDGSSVTASATGDGLANGTAVASNIASTNAFKNALLRLFMITEQSAEDASKNGAEDARDTPAQKKVSAAKTVPPVKKDESDAKTKIRTDFIDNDQSPVTKEDVNGLMERFKADGKSGDELFEAIHTALKTGEV